MSRLRVGYIVLVLSLSAMAFSFFREFPVYDEDVPSDEFAVFEDIGEWDLVSDATFSGVSRSVKTGRLYSTYDRSQPRGRKACPT